MGIVRRVVEPRLSSAIFDELQKRQIAPSQRTPQELLITVCNILDSWHIVEDAGNNRSKSGYIELLQETVYGHDAEAYCMSTVQSETGIVEVLKQVRSNLPASEGCMDTLHQARKAGLTILPFDSNAIQPGDIAIWQHGVTQKGHTGRVYKVAPGGGFVCFEGNTGPGAGVERSGNGCYMKQRDRKMHGQMHLVAFIREQFT